MLTNQQKRVAIIVGALLVLGLGLTAYIKANSGCSDCSTSIEQLDWVTGSWVEVPLLVSEQPPDPTRPDRPGARALVKLRIDGSTLTFGAGCATFTTQVSLKKSRLRSSEIADSTASCEPAAEELDSWLRDFFAQDPLLSKSGSTGPDPLYISTKRDRVKFVGAPG